MDVSVRQVISFVLGVLALVVLFSLTQGQVGGFESFVEGAI